MLEQQLCFTCNFWTGYVRMRDDPTIFRCKGSHYKTAPENERGFRGYGGAKWKIITHDGREIITTNLWHQGTIPPHFREELPDNCQLIPQ